MKQELLKIIDQELLEKLFGFCYARTRDSQEAQELCSEAAEELHVPTVYVEEELEILSQGRMAGTACCAGRTMAGAP